MQALSVILGGLPKEFPAAIAIVIHLSPEYKRILAELLTAAATCRSDRLAQVTSCVIREGLWHRPITTYQWTNVGG